jgi:hypothetical protein
MTEEVKSESKKEDWMNSKWRPMMGWMYMVVCMFDMILFPVLWSLLQTVTHTPITQWNPLTLQGAGLFHIAMGAVLGIAAFGRTQEKLNGANNGGIQAPTTGFASGPSAPSQPAAGGFGNTGGFNSPAPTTSFAPAPSWGTTPISADPAPAVVTGFGGKPAPAPTAFPAI